MSNYFNPDSYTIKNQLQDMLRYGNDVITCDDGVIMKNHEREGYVEIIVPANNSKGHNTYNYYYDSNGNFTHWTAHSSNS